jgi:hypothetical protein
MQIADRRQQAGAVLRRATLPWNRAAGAANAAGGTARRRRHHSALARHRQNLQQEH